jgi:hypothetical protein
MITQEMVDAVQSIKKGGGNRLNGKSELGLQDKAGNYLDDIYAPENADRVNEGLTREKVGMIETFETGHRVYVPKVDESQFIRVRSNLKNLKDGGSQVAFFEQNLCHVPNGESFIADSNEHLVACSEKLCEALRNGFLVVVR